MKTVLLFAFAACATPKVGATCMAGDSWCQDPKTNLVCRAGIVASYSCTGPKGCAEDSQRKVNCDQSTGAIPAGLCLPELDGRAQCSADANAYIFCTGGTWREVACPASTKCQDGDLGIVCK